MNMTTSDALCAKIAAGRRCLDRLEALSGDADGYNRELLMRLLRENSGTAYGEKYGFGEISSPEEYVRRVPLTTWADYEGYIDELTRGAQGTLCARPVAHFARSSGSVGKPKLIPMCGEAVEMFTDYSLNTCFAVMDRRLGSAWKKTRGVSLACIKPETLPCGASCGAVSGKVREAFRATENLIYTSPPEATWPQGGADCRYLHLRFALMERDLSFMTCAFLSTAADAMKYLEHNWRTLVRDIRLGVIDRDVCIPQSQRARLAALISPMPQRADELEREFLRGFDGILTRIWPEFRFLFGIGGGGFRAYAAKLRRYLGSAALHLSVYSASEGIFAACLEPDNEDMALIPDSAFYEFIDVRDETAPPVTMGGVKAGHDYELVITNLSGLYRYRIGDVVRVTGFLGTLPLIRFLYRKNQLVSIAGEKTNDDMMNAAVTQFARKAGFEVVEYSLYADRDHSPGRYVVFIEGERFTRPINLPEYPRMLEEELSRCNPSYGEKTRSGILSPLKLYFLRKNSYAVYRGLMTATGASGGQLKPVRLIDTPVRKSFFFSMTDDRRVIP